MSNGEERREKSERKSIYETRSMCSAIKKSTSRERIIDRSYTHLWRTTDPRRRGRKGERRNGMA